MEHDNEPDCKFCHPKLFGTGAHRQGMINSTPLDNKIKQEESVPKSENPFLKADKVRRASLGKEAPVPPPAAAACSRRRGGAWDGAGRRRQRRDRRAAYHTRGESDAGTQGLAVRRRGCRFPAFVRGGGGGAGTGGRLERRRYPGAVSIREGA